ncbi:MAG: glycine cleavage system protein GcvH [Anaerolineae bacterium]|nr:glycine cleavage system protein GcvH [Anaerolineae bacterium]
MAVLNYPEDLKYTRSDEWVRVEGDSATVGISDYAQDALNDIVYIELPSVGDTVKAGQRFGLVESVKAASDLNSPVSGEVTAVNDKLDGEPELVNSDPYGAGWLIKVKLSSPNLAAEMMDAAAYEAYNASR